MIMDDGWNEESGRCSSVRLHGSIILGNEVIKQSLVVVTLVFKSRRCHLWNMVYKYGVRTYSVSI